MSNVQQTDWISIHEVSAVRPERMYITLPVLADTAYTWNGASEIIAQYDYSAPNNFTLKEYPTAAPTGVNYVLCIRYRIGGTVYRYKLWQNIGEVLNVPLYNGVLILSTVFCLLVVELRELRGVIRCRIRVGIIRIIMDLLLPLVEQLGV